MKKSFTLVAAVAAAALTLSACHPPNENPSDLKVKTATGVAAPTAKVTSSAEAVADAAEVGYPGYVDCDQATELVPDSVQLDCDDSSSVVKDIEWKATGPVRATGVGTMVKDGETTPGVAVILSEPEQTGNGYVYTRLTVDGNVVPVN